MPTIWSWPWFERPRAAEAAWCRTHDLVGAQRRPFLEQRVGHRAHFPGTSHAQGHQEGLRQKGSYVARASTHCGSGSGQPGCLEEGADSPAHASTFSPRTGKRLVQSSHQRELDRSGQAGHAFHRVPHAASGQCFGTFILSASMVKGRNLEQRRRGQVSHKQ